MWNTITGCVYYDSKNFENLKYTTTRDIKGPKFALFDMDKTLITPKNARNPYSLHTDPDPANYTYLCDKSDLINLLQSLKRKGYVISIITNQTRYTEMLQAKIEHFRRDLEENLFWSPYIFIARNDRYLKPATGTFKLLCKLLGFI
jgi:FMN phosphatase YigB (HAD superfamily)